MSYTNNKNPNLGKDITKYSNECSEAELQINKGGVLHLKVTGGVRAVCFMYKNNTTFTNLLGQGYLLAAKNHKLILVSLNGGPIEGDILGYTGHLEIRNLLVVGNDAKYVDKPTIVKNFDTYTSLESNWDSLDVNYEKLSFTGKNRGSKKTTNKGSIFENVATTYKTFDGSKNEVYLNNKRYTKHFHIDSNTGIPFTGKKPHKGMLPLNYQKYKNTNNAAIVIESEEALAGSNKLIHKKGSGSNYGTASNAVDATSVGSPGSITGYGGD